MTWVRWAGLGVCLLASSVALGGCAALDREFRCETSDACVRGGAPGYCEADGHCSFADEACASGRRYAEAVSGAQSGMCVDESAPLPSGPTIPGDPGAPGGPGGPPDPTAPGGGQSITLGLLAGALGGPGTADGVGREARFFWPRGMAIAGDGNLYVADAENQTIRRIVPATGAVTTVAGLARRSGSTDGSGAEARFSRPIGLAADTGGVLYIGDHLNMVIRRLELATGAVTTIAGGKNLQAGTDGVGLDARFNGPSGLALDGLGNLYVADEDGSTIRRLVLATGAVTTLAGTANVSGSLDGTGAAARFNRPTGVAYADGALYVADRLSHTIRRVALPAGEVTTFAGTVGMSGWANGTGTAARFTFPTEIASDGGGNLYVADMYSHCVRKIVIATAAVTSAGAACGSAGVADGSTGGRLDLPAGLALDAKGTLFVSDNASHTVRQLTMATAQLTTLAGAPPLAGATDGVADAARFARPSDVVSDGAGKLYLSDRSNGRVRVVDLATGAVTTLVSGLGDPRGLALAGATLYVADAARHVVHRVALPSGDLTVLAGALDQPGSAEGTGATARFNAPVGLALAGGALHVADAGNAVVRRIALADGTVTTLAGAAGQAGTVDATAAAARFESMSALAVDPAGQHLYLSQANHVLRRVAIADGATITFAGAAATSGALDGALASARFWRPAGLAFDGPDRLYVADAGNHALRIVTISSGTVATFAGIAPRGAVRLGVLPAGLNEPVGLAVAGAQLVVTTAAENALLSIR